MGLLDRFTGTGTDDDQGEPTKYRVVGQDPQGRRAPLPDEVGEGEWVWKGEEAKPSKQQFKYQYGEHLDPRVKYVMGPMDPHHGMIDFDAVEWTVQPDETAKQRDEMPQWARELRAALDDRPEMEAEDMDALLIREILREEGAKTALSEFKDLKRAENSSGAGLGESVNDPTDLSEVGGRGLLQLFSGYDTIGDVMEDVGRGVKTAATHDVGPAAGSGGGGDRRAPDRREPAQEPDAERREPERKSALRERFEDETRRRETPQEPEPDPEPDPENDRDPDRDPDDADPDPVDEIERELDERVGDRAMDPYTATPDDDPMTDDTDDETGTGDETPEEAAAADGGEQ